MRGVVDQRGACIDSDKDIDSTVGNPSPGNLGEQYFCTNWDWVFEFNSNRWYYGPISSSIVSQ